MISVSKKVNQPNQIKGAVSLTTILMITLISVVAYLIYKSNGLDQRLKAVENKVAGGQVGGVADEKPIDIKKIRSLFTKENITFGDPDKAKVLIVEFSDPSCPFCNVAAGADETIASAMDPQGGRFNWKANGGPYEPPVPELKKLVDEGVGAMVQLYANGHGAGEIAAQALYCANEQGKFWEAHDLLYTKGGYDLINEVVKNDRSKSSEMANFLVSLTDSEKIKSCLSSGKYAKKLSEDMVTAQELGFGGTPLFIINTRKFAGAYSYSDMKDFIDSEIAKK
jgi:protein-disulfide isomerase